MNYLKYYCKIKGCYFYSKKTCKERYKRMNEIHSWRIKGMEVDPSCSECKGTNLVDIIRDKIVKYLTDNQLSPTQEIGLNTDIPSDNILRIMQSLEKKDIVIREKTSKNSIIWRLK